MTTVEMQGARASKPAGMPVMPIERTRNDTWPESDAHRDCPNVE